MLRRTWAVLLAALILILGSAITATAGPHGTDRPFRAAATGQVNFDFSNPRGCGAGFTEVVEAAGLATHLGTFRVSGSHCAGDGVSYDGLMTLTAANGDTISGTYLTHWTITGTTVHVVGTLDVVGGTGRFADAHGQLTQDHVITITAAMPPWPLAMTFVGRIDY
jgi:hypothetical protein